MNPSSLTCPLCFQQYSENNPPRLLTMCGHTFCHHCIKSLVTKKKDKGFKVKCPIDKTSMQMQKPNPSLFPKNIALITILNQPKNSQSYNEFLPIDQNKNVIQEIDSKQSFEEMQFPQKNMTQNEVKIENEVKCIQHGKIKQVYCVQDGEMICTDCALFSFHRSHEIKSMSALIKAQNEMISSFDNIIKEKKQIQSKYLNKQIQNDIFDLLDKKKTFIKKQIHSFFTNLYTSLQQKQKQIQQNLQTKIIEMGTRIQNKIKKEFQNQQKYIQWYNQVQQILKTLQKESYTTVNDKLRTLVKSKFNEEKIKEGKQIIKGIRLKQTVFIENLQNQLQGLQFVNKSQDLKEFIDSISLVDKGNQAMNSTKITGKDQLKGKQKQITQKQQQIKMKQRQITIKQKQITIKQEQLITQEEQLLPCESRKDISNRQQNKNVHHHLYFNDQQLKFNQNQNYQHPSKLFKTNQKYQKLFNSTTPLQNNQKKHLTKTNSSKTLSLLKLQSSKNQFTSKQHKFSQRTSQNLNKSPQNLNQTSQILNKTFQFFNKNRNYQSVQKIRPSTVDFSRSQVRSSTSLQKSNGSLQKSNGSRINSKPKIQPKFIHQTLIKQILQDSIQSVDLTGQQISCQELFHIVKAISQSQKVKTLKMMRNKLDDAFIDKCFQYILNVERVNLAQNKLTQQSVDKILQILKSSPNYKLIYLNMGQNRIVERKNRKLLQEFKKLQINVVF